MQARLLLISVALMLTALPSQAMPVTYAIMSTNDLHNLADYKALDTLVARHKEPQFTSNLDTGRIMINPRRVIVIRGGYKGIRRALAQFNSKNIKLRVNQQTGPAVFKIQICYKKILAGKDTTYVVIGRSNDGWDVTRICDKIYDYTHHLQPTDILGIETLVQHLDQAKDQRGD